MRITTKFELGIWFDKSFFFWFVGCVTTSCKSKSPLVICYINQLYWKDITLRLFPKFTNFEYERIIKDTCHINFKQNYKVWILLTILSFITIPEFDVSSLLGLKDKAWWWGWRVESTWSSAVRQEWGCQDAGAAHPAPWTTRFTSSPRLSFSTCEWEDRLCPSSVSLPLYSLWLWLNPHCRGWKSQSLAAHLICIT